MVKKCPCDLSTLAESQSVCASLSRSKIRTFRTIWVTDTTSWWVPYPPATKGTTMDKTFAAKGPRISTVWGWGS